jgi:hypothetical protein
MLALQSVAVAADDLADEQALGIMFKDCHGGQNLDQAHRAMAKEVLARDRAVTALRK